MLQLDKSFWDCQNPEFIEMAKYTTDLYWQDKMLMGAKGKFPKKVSYRNGEIRFRKNSSMATEKLSRDPGEASMTVIQFIRKFTGLSSDLDKKENLRHLTSTAGKYLPFNECAWKDIKGKGAKADILNRYAREIAAVMKLTELQRCQLIKTIQCGLFCGRLSNDHVIMDCGKIRQVTGLYYDTEQVVFRLDPKLAPFKPAKFDSRSAINLYDSYITRRTIIPVFGDKTRNIIEYLVWQLEAQEIAQAPVVTKFIIVTNDPMYDDMDNSSPPKDIEDTLNMIESTPVNWTDSPDSYENSTSVSSFEYR